MGSLSKKDLIKFLPKRPKNSHKGSFGKVLVIAGSEKYPGAAFLNTCASYRVGAGLVALASSLFVRKINASRISEVTYIDLDEVSKKISEFNTVLIGSGLGEDEDMIKFLSVFFGLELPKAVIDADGLNYLSKIPNWWVHYKFKGILTPHPGEFSRLTRLSTEEIQKDRQKYALEFSKKWNQVLVLKGAQTVVVSPKGDLYVDDFSGAALATAGTGDVLAGMIAGFIAQGVDLFEAASLGVYIHSEAARLLEDELGKAGVLSSDLLLKIPVVLKNE